MGFFDKKKGKELQMNDKKFDAFLNECYEELIKKQDSLMKKYNLGKYDEYWFDQETEVIQFKTDGKVGLEFYFTSIGSWSGKSNSWMWAWANESVTEELRTKSATIKELAGITGRDFFEKEAFEADEVRAHELTSMAVHHLNALGMYIAPSKDLKIFIALIKEK